MRFRRGAALAALRRLAFASAFLAILPAAAIAQEPDQEREQVLPGSGIRYPLGYDTETEGVLEGRVLRVETPGRGPVILRLESSGRPVTVLTAPGWYWERTEGKPAAGDLVRVTGSKTLGADGELYVVAREIIRVGAGCGCALRDEQGRPLWRGRMREMPARRCPQPAVPPPATGR